MYKSVNSHQYRAAPAAGTDWHGANQMRGESERAECLPHEYHANPHAINLAMHRRLIAVRSTLRMGFK
jgi:hypothetical protein